MNKIPNDMGTAVVIQSMVFGNYNDNSGSGVMFTRNPNTGAKEIFGDFLTNCQGEDVVAGAITAPPISEMKKWNSKLYNELVKIGEGLELKNKDLQEIEFTVEDGVLSILQTRNPLRSSYAEIKIALDLLEEGVIEELGDRITEGTFMKLRVPVLPADFKKKANAKGIGSGGYFATGKAAFSVKEVMESAEPTILVAEETTPDDIKAMEKAEGILTFKGSATCHAAVVARGMNKPCVVGCPDVEDDFAFGTFSYVLIDGQTGEVYLSEMPFDLEFNTNIPVELLGSLFEVAITEEDWIMVHNYEEALSLEDYIYKIGVPVEGLTSEELIDLAERFDKVVLINPERRDKVSDFLGEPNPEGMENARELDSHIGDYNLENVFFDSGTWVTSNVAKAYKTMADVMNPDFIGYTEKDFIDNVMGDAETFEKISEHCPKCGGLSWIKFEEDSVMQHCVCGLNKFLYLKIDGTTLTRVPVTISTVVLPVRGSQLSQILGCLVGLGELTSHQIARQLSITVDKATTNLSILRKRGLITALEDRKGRLGGSLWATHNVVKKKWYGGK